MARVLVLIPDLLFGSQVQGALSAAGYETELVGETDKAVKSLAKIPVPAVMVVDLANPDFDGLAFVQGLEDGAALVGTRILGVHSHVDEQTRLRAEQAKFDRVVPRSRMAREGAALVASLISG